MQHRRSHRRSHLSRVECKHHSHNACCTCLLVYVSQVAQQALGEGPIAQGLSNVLGGFLQPAGYSGRLNVSACKVDPGLGWGVYCSQDGRWVRDRLRRACPMFRAGLLQPAGYSGRLNLSSCSGDEGEGVVSKGPSKEGNGVERGDIVETLLFPAGV